MLTDLSYLAYCNQSSSRFRELLPPCPTPREGDRVIYDSYTGKYYERGCGSSKCPVCIHLIARKLSAAIALALPDFHVRLSPFDDTWQQGVRKALNRFRELARSAFPGYHDCAHVEPNPSGDGCHIHLWCWTDPGVLMDQGTASSIAQRARMGWNVFVEPRITPDWVPLSYGLKSVLDADPRESTMPVEIVRFKDLNGGRLHTATPGFWRGRDGARLKGVRAAKAAAAQRSSSGTLRRVSVSREWAVKHARPAGA